MTGALGVAGLVGLVPPTLRTIPEAVAANIAIARARTRARIMAVVKADGYGHGAVTVARTAVAAGAEWLGTTDLSEALNLRAAGLTVPILTWLNPSGVDAEAAAIGGIDVAVGSLDELEALLGQPSCSSVRVHLHLDTGMAREGCPAHEWDALVASGTSDGAGTRRRTHGASAVWPTGPIRRRTRRRCRACGGPLRFWWRRGSTPRSSIWRRPRRS